MDTVTWWLGSAEARTSKWWLSFDGDATLYPYCEIEFIHLLLATDRLVARVTPFFASTITAIFDLTGLENALIQAGDRFFPLQDAGRGE